MRAGPLLEVAAPMLFVEGGRDPLCQIPALEDLLSDLRAPATLRIIEGGDHSHRLPSGRGQGSEAAVQQVGKWVREWIGAIQREGGR